MQNVPKKLQMPWKIRIQRQTTRKEVVMAGEQKWEMVESNIRIVFFVWDSYSWYFIYTGNFQVPPEKYHLTQKGNFYPKSQFDLSFWYLNLLKKGSHPLPATAPPPSPMEDANMKSLWIGQCIFLIVIKL